MNEWIQAASSDDVSALQELLARDPELLDRIHPRYERTALQLAAAWDAVRAVAFLLDHGANVFTTDPDGQTALHLAASSNGVAVVRAVLQHLQPVDDMQVDGTGSSRAATLVNQRNRDGYTALLLASAHGHRDCCSLLLSLGSANPMLALDKAPYSTALDLALRGQHHDVVNCLRDWEIRHKE